QQQFPVRAEKRELRRGGRLRRQAERFARGQVVDGHEWAFVVVQCRDEVRAFQGRVHEEESAARGEQGLAVQRHARIRDDGRRGRRGRGVGRAFPAGGHGRAGRGRGGRRLVAGPLFQGRGGGGRGRGGRRRARRARVVDGD